MLAAAIAARSEPGPLSSPFVTVSVAADAVACSASVISAATVAARVPPCMHASSRLTGPRSNGLPAFVRLEAGLANYCAVSMGDMGILRKPPRGWMPARAFAVQHRSYERGQSSSEGEHLHTSRDLEVEWEVCRDGRDPYRFVETRKAPGWVSSSRIGSGKRWFSVRLKRTYGLMPTVGLPCFVDPDNPHKLWIDWDAGYELHETAWKEHTAAAPDRRAAAAERSKREEAAAIARAEAKPVDADTAALLDLQRLYGLGVTSSATVLSAQDTGRAVNNVPVWRFELQHDEGRLTTLERAVPRRSLERYGEGNRITVYSDPNDPDAFALG